MSQSRTFGVSHKTLPDRQSRAARIVAGRRNDQSPRSTKGHCPAYQGRHLRVILEHQIDQRRHLPSSRPTRRTGTSVPRYRTVLEDWPAPSATCRDLGDGHRVPFRRISRPSSSEKQRQSISLQIDVVIEHKNVSRGHASAPHDRAQKLGGPQDLGTTGGPLPRQSAVSTPTSHHDLGRERMAKIR